MSIFPRPRLAAGAFVAVAAFALAGCASNAGSAPAASEAASGSTADEHDHADSRVAVTYDGGILVLDGTSLETIADLPLAGFNRINAAADGTRAFITTSEGFQVLDTGLAEGTDPELTDVLFEAAAAGHVVTHADKTVLFADGTGDITIFDTDSLTNDALPKTRTVSSEAAHHGVAIELSDGSLLSTLGTDEGRSGVRVLDAQGTELARDETCPSVHGEGTLKGEVVVFGCSDGVLVFDDGAFTKLDAPDEYGRTGNAYVTETSPIMVGDYNANPDSEGYLLTQLAFVDSEAKSMDVVDLPDGASYTWRGVGRDAHDNVIVLSSDGSLHVLDESGELVDSFDVIAPWQSPVEWQDPHPGLKVVGDTAYVTEPSTESIYAIDLHSGDVLATGSIGVAANEFSVVTAAGH